MFQNFDLQKVCHGHGVQFVSITPFDGKYQNLQTPFFYFFDFRLGATCSQESNQTDMPTRGQRDTDKAMAVGEIEHLRIKPCI